MTRLRQGTVWMGIGLAALFAGIAACDEEPTGTNGNGGGGGGNISDPATFQSLMEQDFLNGVTGVMDGFNRLFVAASGGPQDGVVITPTGGNDFTAEISVDLNGDGSRESTIFGASSGDISVGASISVSMVDDPDQPTLAATFSATVTETVPGSVVLDGIGGDFSADPPGSGNAGSVIITDGVVSLDLVSATPDGFMDCEISGEGDFLFVTTTFQPAANTLGWEVVFSGDVDFTVP